MNIPFMMPLLNHYEYNPDYENLSEEEKQYIDYVDTCLNLSDEKFSDVMYKNNAFCFRGI